MFFLLGGIIGERAVENKDKTAGHGPIAAVTRGSVLAATARRVQVRLSTPPETIDVAGGRPVI
jgi:hypothetical protein